MAADVTRQINDAFNAEFLLRGSGRLPPPDQEIQAALIPAGGDWECVAPGGAVTRSIVWRGREVALINPRGDLDDITEGRIAMGMRATPVMDKALRTICVLSSQPGTASLIRSIAQAAIDTVMREAPAVREPEDDDDTSH